MDRLVNDRSTNGLTRRTAFAASLGGLAALGAAGMTGSLARQATPVATPVVAVDAAFLFVQAGFTSGTLADNGDGTYLLTLLDAPAQTVYFSDRPDRIAGALPTGRFLEVLDFDGGDPPNAALVIQVDAENTDVIVFELTAPVYDARVASLTYTATLLQGFDQFVKTGVGFVEEPLTADTLPQEFGACSLFIDSLLGCNPLDPRGC
jgi:hypothetical protein